MPHALVSRSTPLPRRLENPRSVVTNRNSSSDKQLLKLAVGLSILLANAVNAQSAENKTVSFSPNIEDHELQVDQNSDSVSNQNFKIIVTAGVACLCALFLLACCYVCSKLYSRTSSTTSQQGTSSPENIVVINSAPTSPRRAVEPDVPRKSTDTEKTPRGSQSVTRDAARDRQNGGSASPRQEGTPGSDTDKGHRQGSTVLSSSSGAEAPNLFA